VLKNGGIITLPTDTVYGLAVDPRNPAAVERLYRLKGRDGNKPLACLLAYRNQALALSSDLNDAFWRLAKGHWPGGLTLVAPRSLTTPAWLTRGMPGIGMRWPDCPWVWALCDALGSPVAASSANLSGRPAETSGREAARQWGSKIDLLVDGGRSSQGIASSVVDCSGASPRLLRAGRDADKLGI
jgi:L-threonylcarbamoyladenylate synthase